MRSANQCYYYSELIKQIQAKQMGCSTAKSESKHLEKASTLFGALHITVLDCHLQRNPNAIMTMDPYIKIVVSNQSKSTQIKKKGGFNTRFDQHFVFAINSCYKPFGRSMQVHAMDQNLFASDKLVGYGLLDLDAMVRKGVNAGDARVRLAYECSEVGWVNLRIEFVEETKETISFRFQSLDITKRTSLVGVMDCWIRLTVGEEVMETQRSKDTPQCPPLWNDQIYSIEVPKCVTVVLLQAFDDRKLIGKSQMEVGPFVRLTQQQAFKEIIKTAEDVPSGILSFSVVRGQKAQFKADKRIYNKDVSLSSFKTKQPNEEVPAEPRQIKQLQLEQENQVEANPKLKIQQQAVIQSSNTEMIKATDIQKQCNKIGE